MTRQIDTRGLAPATALETLRDAVRLAKPGTELAALLPPESSQVTAALAAPPFACWFSHEGDGTLRLVVRHPDSPGSISEYLSWDHDRLDAALAEALKAAAAGDWAAATDAAAIFSGGLMRHIDIEDNLLFPEFEDRTGIRDGGPTQVMRMEHEEIKEAVAGIVESIGRRDHDDLMRWHANLLGVLVEHNMKEEQILYPGTDRLMPLADREDLLQNMLLRSGV